MINKSLEIENPDCDPLELFIEFRKYVKYWHWNGGIFFAHEFQDFIKQSVEIQTQYRLSGVSTEETVKLLNAWVEIGWLVKNVLKTGTQYHFTDEGKVIRA